MTAFILQETCVGEHAGWQAVSLGGRGGGEVGVECGRRHQPSAVLKHQQTRGQLSTATDKMRKIYFI